MPLTRKSAVSDGDIMMYLMLVWKHLRLMILLVCLSMMVGLVYYLYTRSFYYSSALVHYTQAMHPADPEKVYDDSTKSKWVDLAVIWELTSDHVVGRAVKKLGLNVTQRELKAKYLKRVRAKFNSEHNIILEVWPYSSAWARKLPEVLVQEYVLYRDERRLEHMRATFRTFSDDMAELRTKMDEVFNQKFDFQSTNELTKILIDLNQYRELPREIYTLKHQLAIMDHTREALQSHDRDTVAKLSLLSTVQKDIQMTEVNPHQITSEINVGQVIPKEDPASGLVVLPAMITSPLKQAWEDLDKERRRLQELAQDLGHKYLPGHPKMLAVQKQLDAVNKSLELELSVEQNRFDLEYAARVDKVAQLERKLPAYDEITRRYQKSVKDYKHFDTGQLAWDRLYDQMSRRLGALDFGVDKERAQLQYVGTFEFNDRPATPNRFKVALYSLLLGLALAIAIPFLMEYVDSRVSDMDQVEEMLHIRGLGVVPRVTESPVENLLLPDAKPDHHVTENFRLIRTNLVMNTATPTLPQVILVTSAMPQEGKTVVAAHLAMSFARKGEQTLLVDADLRRGRLHRLFGCPNKPGLAEVLAGRQAWEEALHPIGSNGKGHNNDQGQEAGEPGGSGFLTVLTCGKHLHWGSELLDSPVFPKLVDEFRQKYQRIIIDTPPVLGLSETSIIQRTADGVLLVIWSEYTPMRNVKTAIQMLQTNGAKFAGFVLNRLDFSALTNRYRYFYYSPYYYRNYKAIPAPATAPVE